MTLRELDLGSFELSGGSERWRPMVESYAAHLGWERSAWYYMTIEGTM
jgi:hypothetical protein